LRRGGKKAGSEHWAYLTRAGSEDQVLAELGDRAAIIGEGVVMSEGRPRDPHGGAISPVFARQAMRTDGEAISIDPEVVAGALSRLIKEAMPNDRRWPWTLQIVAPDSKDSKSVRRKIAAKLEETLPPALEDVLPPEIAGAYVDDDREVERLAQVWIVNDEQALAGFTAASEVLSRAPGGRRLKTRDEAAPLPSSRKLQEAFEWLGISPGKGEVVVDLGASPGAWSKVVADLGAKVIAVDRGPMKVDLPPKRVEIAKISPFEMMPEETADWLLCHVALRPLDVAKLAAKWARRTWARQLVAVFLLPMRDKVKIVKEVLAILEDAGWRGLKARQLFFDGDEVTVFGWLDPRQGDRVPKDPFRMRARTSSGEPRSTARRSVQRPRRRK
jgi:23S rRNA (cytidine2498-2'-O)-methyltransferase